MQSPRAMGIAGDELWYGGVRAPFHGMRSSNSLPTLGTQSSVSLRSGRSQSSSRRWDWDDSPAGYMPRPKRNTVEVPTLAVGAPERWITPAGLVPRSPSRMSTSSRTFGRTVSQRSTSPPRPVRSNPPIGPEFNPPRRPHNSYAWVGAGHWRIPRDKRELAPLRQPTWNGQSAGLATGNGNPALENFIPDCSESRSLKAYRPKCYKQSCFGGAGSLRLLRPPTDLDWICRARSAGFITKDIWSSATPLEPPPAWIDTH